MATNDKSNGGAGPSVNGNAYPIEDHTYDVVVIGAGGSGSAPWSAAAKRAHRLHHQSNPTRRIRSGAWHRRRTRNKGEDDWRHMYDNAGADWLGSVTPSNILPQMHRR